MTIASAKETAKEIGELFVGSVIAGFGLTAGFFLFTVASSFVLAL